MKVNLISTKIEFTKFSIVYHVKLANDQKLKSIHYVSANEDIVNKDLILKPVVIHEGHMKVIFTPSNMIPAFYQGILEESIHDIDEHVIERQYIYEVGEVVGSVLI